MAVKARWPLPEEVNPEGYKCYNVWVPNERFYIAAFKGALFELQKAYSWHNDEAHTALEVAEKWKQTFASHPIVSGDCDMVVPIFQQAGDCSLQVSYDDGATWEDIFNAQTCADEAARQAINDAIDDGKVAVPGQHSGDGTLSTDECKTYSFTLKGKDRYLIPVPVKHGYTVRVFDLQGAWSDGALGALSTWNCPDGNTYSLGECSVVETFSGTDPLPETPHMRVILVGDDIAQDPTGEEGATISGDIGDLTDVYLQANDDAIGDNLGEIRGKVEVCQHTDFDWECIYDFKEGTNGFAAYEDAFTEGVWADGVGWSAVYGTEASGAHRNIVDILRSFTSVNLVYLKVTFDYTFGGADIMASTAWRITLDSDTLLNVDFNHIENGTDITRTWEGSVTGDTLELLFQPARNSGDTGSATITRLVIRGNGDSPC